MRFTIPGGEPLLILGYSSPHPPDDSAKENGPSKNSLHSPNLLLLRELGRLSVNSGWSVVLISSCSFDWASHVPVKPIYNSY